MTRGSSVLVALIVAFGFVVMGFFIGDGLRHIKTTDREVDVRGLAEREVDADTAKFTIKIQHNGATTAAIFPLITDTQKQVVAFLEQEGLKDTEIVPEQWSTTRASPKDLIDDPTLPHYSVSGAIDVITHNVAAVQSAYRKLNDLQIKTNGGVSDADVSYSFTGLGPIRAEMIAAATKDARNAALQFAQDSGSQVGSIRSASQGAFEIMAPGQTYDDIKSFRKNVRVVTTVDYELKD